MRTLIIGAGAIGSYLACKLTESGADVTLHGLGPRFNQIMKTGVAVAARNDMKVRRVAVKCELEPPAPDNWNLLIFAIKAQDLPRAARQFSTHAKNAKVLLPQNGLPYWQFLGTSSGPARRLVCVDPNGATEHFLPLSHTAGCVVTKGLTIQADGIVIETILPSDSFSIGDVVAGSNVAAPIVSFLQTAGLPARQAIDIRHDKWRKLLVNVAFNPLGAISHLGFGEVLDLDPGERLARTIMDETLNIARHYGMQGDIDLEPALNRARSSRTHKTSMLQDVETGRQLEVEPILGVLIELAEEAKLPAPTLQTIYDCVRLIDHALIKGPIRQTAEGS